MVSYFGKVIEFVGSGTSKFGYVTKEESGKLRVIDQNGRHHSISPNSVIVIYQEADHFQALPELADRLETRIRQFRGEVDTELLWEAVCSEPRLFSAEELAEVYFNETLPAQISAVFRAVQEDQIRFKVRGLNILPRSPEQVEQQRITSQRRMEKEALRKQSVAWMKDLLAKGESPEEMGDLLRKIEDFIQRREGTQIQSWLSEVSPAQTPLETAVEILALTGRLKEDTHQLLILAGVEEHFPQEALQTCARLRHYETTSGPLDQSETFTIDDQDTCELDDALSVKLKDGHVQVGIHIADVGYFVEKDDLLDREALRRSTSVYLPDRTVYMFPPRLSGNLASLNANEARPVMSFTVEFSEEGKILDWTVERSQIQVDSRLSYDMADELLSGAPEGPLAPRLQKLSAISRQLAAERHSRGAVTINRPELKIRFEEGQIDIKILDPASPARRLVSEMMILANSLAAQFAAEEKVPLIFRAQNPPAEEIKAPENYDPVALDELFQKLEPGRLSIYPQPHASLGLKCYTQLTSPIRRFTDLVIQRQLAAFLSGRPLPYELQELMQVLATVQAAEGNVRVLERRARRLFLLRYLAGFTETPFSLVVIKKQSAGYLVETLDLFVRGQLLSQQEYEPGEVVSAVVDTIEPEKGIFRLRPS